MEWSSFLGALVGGVAGVLAILGVVLVWDEYYRRKSTPPVPDQKSSSLDDIREKHLEQHILQHFETLFPGWRIYSLDVNTESPIDRAKNTGIRRRTEAGEIDMLCIDSSGDLVVIELKRNKAPDTVVAQIDRYITWVESTLAQPNQRVRGLIIAKSLDKHLAYTLAKRPDVDLWTYQWLLEFDQNAARRVIEMRSPDLNMPDEMTEQDQMAELVQAAAPT